MRVLLFSTTTGYQLRSFSDAAQQLGIELLLATDRCHHLEDPWRDGAVPVRFFDEQESVDAILAVAREKPIDGVIAVGDRPTTLAARAAEALGLRWNSVEAAEISRSKRAMRRAFTAARLEVPWFVDLPTGADPRAIGAAIPYPCVVKPLGLSGSRGVIRADSAEQLVAAVKRIHALLARPDVRAQRSGLLDALIVEGYLEGPEYAIEGLLAYGRLRVLAIFDKPDPLIGPFFEETIYVTPPAISAALEQQIVTEVQRATEAIGLRHGPVHAECRVGPNGVAMLEVAARPIGGICSKVLRFERDGESASLEEVLLRHACGEDVSAFVRERQAAGVMMIPIPKRGIYKSVAGQAAAAALPHVEDVIITAKEDQLIEPLPEGDSYLGFIFARAGDSATVVATLRAAHQALEFEIQQEVPMIR